MYVYVYIYTYTYIYIHISGYVYIHTYMGVAFSVCTCKCTCIWIFTSMYLCHFFCRCCSLSCESFAIFLEDDLQLTTSLNGFESGSICVSL